MDYFYAASLPGLLEKYFNLAIPHGRCTSSLGDLPSGRSKFQRLHSSRCCAFSLSFRYPSSIIQSMRICLDFLFLYSPPSFLPLSPSVESCLLECVQSSSSALF